MLLPDLSRELFLVQTGGESGYIQKAARSLATTVCQESKIDDDQWYKILPNLKTILIRRWSKECQNVTDLEAQKWEDQIQSEYRALALANREPAWKRFLYYRRCRHLRYLAILISIAAVSFLCPQASIFLVLGRSQRLWGWWYYVSTFVTLVCVPVALAYTIRAERSSVSLNVQRIIAGVLLLGLIVPLLLFFTTLFWQMTGSVYEWLSWGKSLLAVPFCIVGSIAVVSVIFNWTTKRSPHPLEICFPKRSSDSSAQDARERVEHRLTQFALEVCRSAPMDDNSFQHETAEDIENFLYIQWEDLVLEGIDPQTALARTLTDFGAPEKAMYTDDPRIRLLFYRRHKATRYLVMIGIGLLFVYILLLAVAGTEVDKHWYPLSQYTNLDFLRAYYTNGSHLWGLWTENVMNGSLLAFCIFLKSRLKRLWPLNHVCAVGAIWSLVSIAYDAFVSLDVISTRWNGWSWVFPLVVVVSVFSFAFFYLVACAVCEYFSPFSDKQVAKVRRWLNRMRWIH